jgi:hypothetical protein
MTTNFRRVAPQSRPVRTGLAVALSTVLLAALVLAAPPWMRASAAVLWVLVVPGLPWAVRMRLGDRGDTVAVAGAISLALAAVVGGGMAVLGIWSPMAAVIVLTGVSLCALVPGASLRRGGARRNHDPGRYYA